MYNWESFTFSNSYDNVEVVACKLQMNHHLLIILAVYRPPNNDAIYLQSLCSLIQDVAMDFPEAIIWIGGDINLPNIDWLTNSHNGNNYPVSFCNLVLELFCDLGISQMVTFPTRGNNTLDIFATNRPNLINTCTPIPGISDHDAIYVESLVTAKYRCPAKRKLYQWAKTDFQLLSKVIVEFTDSFTASNGTTSCVQRMWNDFKNMCVDCMELVPYKYPSSRFNQPWITNRTKRICRKKKRMYNKARSTGLESDWSNYKNIKKLTQHECRKAYHNYVSRISYPSTNNKKFWSFIKNCRRDNAGITSLLVEGNTITEDVDKANALNSQFKSVFTVEDTSVMPKVTGQSFPGMDSIEINVEGVNQLLSNLDPQKAGGPDNIPTRFLKEFSIELAPCLTIIFQASLEQGIVPNDWRKAFVVPIYKKGDRSSPANYRPISLTSVVCKTLEHIISNNICCHLNKYNILSDQQHGFRSRRSCETQLVETINDFATTLNESGQIDAIFLDISKAFDTVPINRLCTKLNHYGIRGSTLSWIENFLTNRTQQVVVNGEYSQLSSVTSGVPQGSVLGPLLFICYINDIVHNISSKIRLYADDTLLYRSIHSEQDVIALQNDLNTLSEWAKHWQMTFNPTKTEFLRITNKTNYVMSSYYLSDTLIPQVSHTKYLGIVIDENLKWTQHVNMISAKANSVRSLLQRNLVKCPPTIKSHCYNTFVRPILEYACTIRSPYHEQNIYKLEMVQQRAARFVMNDYNRTASVSKMLHTLQWHTLEKMTR